MRELNAHRWATHREEMLVNLKKARERAPGFVGKGSSGSGEGGSPNGNGNKSAPLSAAEKLEEASILVISPQRFEMNSSLVWQARAVAIREWGWPGDISPGDFLDTYLFESFKQRGILLGAYQIIREGENDRN